MIEVDISGVWGAMSLPDLLAAEARINGSHRKLLDEEGNFRVTMPGDEELARLENTAEQIRRKNEVLVVLGMGGEWSCARGCLELLEGDGVQILFAGSDFSTRRRNALVKALEGRDFSLFLIPGQKEEPETLVALRSLKWLLERRYGTDGARQRIYAAGGSGVLQRMAREEGWTYFEEPASGILMPGVLLVLAAAGMDLREMVCGAREMLEQCSILSYENPLWLYVGAREGLLSRGKNIEVLRCPEPDFGMLGFWWQALVTREDSRGPFPVCSCGGADMLPGWGREDVFETLAEFAPSGKQILIQEDARNIDGLNHLAGRSLAQLQEARFRAMGEMAEESGTGILRIRFGEIREKTLGALLCFFSLSCALSRGMRFQAEQ